jgi:large subunit ribosomal protein L30
VKAYLKVTQTRSVIGQAEPMCLTIKGLGLRRPGSTVVVKNTPSFRGAVKKVMHLVSVEETDTAPPKKIKTTKPEAKA